MSRKGNSGYELGRKIGFQLGSKYPLPIIAAFIFFLNYDLNVLRIKAVMGNPSAQYELSVAYHYGYYDLEKDEALKTKWNDKAASNGQAIAQYYKYMRLKEDDRRSAIVWLKLSAEGGFYRSQVTLAEMHEEGEFVRQDLVEAYAWHSFAAASGIGSSIKKLEEMQSNLHRDVILRGDERARDIQKTMDARIADGSLKYKATED